MVRRLRPFLWPACCAVLAAVFLVLVARFYHPVYGFTSLLQLDASNEDVMLPELRARPVFIYHHQGGYDGLYYAQLSCRPLLNDPVLVHAMDNLGYRARRILVSWTAWLLALGDPTRAIDIYCLLNAACWLGLAILLFAVFPPRSAHDLIAWGGLLFSAGALASVRLSLTDLPALLLVTGTVVAVQRGHLRSATGLLAAAGLTRETSLLSATVLVRGTWRATLLRCVLIVLPLALWLGYIHWKVGPGDNGWSNFALPGLRFLEKWRAALADLRRPDFPLLYGSTLLALIALTVQAVWLVARPQWHSLWWRLGIGYVAMMLMLGTAVWEGHPGAALRVLLPLNLAFNALAPRTRAGLALLILGNLTAPAGLVQLTELPNDGVELAASRADGITVFVRTQSGWFGVERDVHNFWAWSRGDAELAVQTQPAPTSLALAFRLRSLAPRRVEIRQDGALLWAGELGAHWQAITLHCHDGSLAFHTDAPAIRESQVASERGLAFCIDRVRISAVQSTPATNTAPSGR